MPERRRPGPVYDDAMKILAEYDLPAVLSLVGIRDGPVEAVNVELPSSAMRADLIVRTPQGIVHVEYVNDLTGDLPLRMLEYRLRLRRRHPSTPLHQYVLALRDRRVPDRYDDPDPGRLSGSWTVVRLADLDPATLLDTPATAALAALARGSDAERAAVLVAALTAIAARATPARASLLLDVAATLASIVLPDRTIATAVKEAVMPVPIRETPLGRRWYEEGVEEGREQGAREAALRLTVALLRRRFGDDPRIAAVAEALAELPDEDRLSRIAAIDHLEDAQA